MKRILIFLGAILLFPIAQSQNCIDVGVVLDRDMNTQIFSNVLLAGERFLCYDQQPKNGYKVTNFKNFRVCNGFYRYFDSPCDAYVGQYIQGNYWNEYSKSGQIDYYDLMVKNKLVD